MTGTATLLRFDLSRDRTRIVIWVALLAVMVVGVAASWDRLYPTADERLQLVAILSGNPALTALLGPLTNPLSTGGLTAWRIGVGIIFVLGLVNIFTVTRHVRAEEQSGRTELLLAGRSSRVAPLYAAVGVTLVSSAAFVIIGTGLMAAVGLAPLPSLLFTLTGAAAAMVFTGVSAITNQLTHSARSANGIAGAVLVASWVVAGVGNLQDNLLQWFSPFGWIAKADPFGGNHWEVLIVPLGVTAVLLVLATAIQGRRDVGAAAIDESAGAPAAGSRLTGSYSLAWRLERSTVVWWILGYALVGLVLGISRSSLIEFASSSPALADLFETLGGSGAIIDAFLATYIGIGGIIATFFVVSVVMRLNQQELAGHTSLALSTATRRSRWVSSYVVVALAGGVLVLLALGVVLGMAFAVQGDDGIGDLTRLLTAAAAWLPALVFAIGLALAFVGVLPRWAGTVWILMGLFALLTELGPVFGLPSWLVNLSPFTHVPNLPAQELSAVPLLGLTIGGLVLALVGYIAFQTRDVRN